MMHPEGPDVGHQSEPGSAPPDPGIGDLTSQRRTTIVRPTVVRLSIATKEQLMTDTPSTATSRPGSSSATSASSSAGGRSSGTTSLGGRGSSDSPLVSEHGRTTIADAVVAKIAGIAAREVSGVHALGGGAARAVGALRERLSNVSGPSPSQGVTVEVGERQAAIDLTLVAEYGVSIADLADGIRRNVISAVERMTGLDVTEVNIDVQDVYLASDDDSDQDDDASEPRVQ